MKKKCSPTTNAGRNPFQKSDKFDAYAPYVWDMEIK